MSLWKTAKYFLKEASYYNYINKSGCYTVNGVDEHEALTEFRDALKIFDISPEIEDKMFRILASVLHLGNVCFKGDDKADWANADSGLLFSSLSSSPNNSNKTKQESHKMNER